MTVTDVLCENVDLSSTRKMNKKHYKPHRLRQGKLRNFDARVNLPIPLNRSPSESMLRDRKTANVLRSYAKTSCFAAPKSAYRSMPNLCAGNLTKTEICALKPRTDRRPSGNCVSTTFESGTTLTAGTPTVHAGNGSHDPCLATTRSNPQTLAPLNYETKRTCDALAKSVSSPVVTLKTAKLRMGRDSGKMRRKKCASGALKLAPVECVKKEDVAWLVPTTDQTDANEVDSAKDTVASLLRAYVQNHQFDLDFGDEDDVCPSLRSRTLSEANGKDTRQASKASVATIDRLETLCENLDLAPRGPFSVAQARHKMGQMDTQQMESLLSQMQQPKPTTAPTAASRRDSCVTAEAKERWDSATSLARMAHSLRMSLPWIAQAHQEFKRWLPHEAEKTGTLTVSQFKDYCMKEMNCDSEKDDFIEEATRAAFKGADTIGIYEWISWYTAYAFSDRFNSTTVEEASNRKLSKQLGIALADVQKLHRDFAQCDEDGSDVIEESEFRGVLASILKVPEDDIPRDRLHRAWMQAGNNHTGLDFENFLMWYKKYMYDPDNTASALEVIHGISLPKCSRDKSLKFHAH